VAGSLTRVLMDDHRRLDALFRSAVADPFNVDAAIYDQFRAGLLRHIGLEEKIVLPTLQRLREGIPCDLAAKLRLDHGALAALLMPTPTPAIVAAIRAILSAHNALEEGPEGLYEVGDHVAESEVGSLLERLRAAPEVTVTPTSDSTAVMKTVRAALERAGYHLSDYEAAGEGAMG
jgi:hemerythrin HHE cation binding domain-containing protein